MAISLRGGGGDYNLLIGQHGTGSRSWRGEACRLASTQGNAMNLPKIDLSALPDLDTLTGVFGSLANPLQAAGSDDSVVIIMVYIYEILGG
jgi:hypothetical protein